MSFKRLRDSDPSQRKIGFFPTGPGSSEHVSIRIVPPPGPPPPRRLRNTEIAPSPKFWDPTGRKLQTSPSAFPVNVDSIVAFPLRRTAKGGRHHRRGHKTTRAKKHGGMNLRASTLEKRAKVEAKIKEKEELAAKRRMVAMQKKQEKSSATPEELEMIAAKAAGEANRLQAEADYLAEAARRARDTPRELDELTALLERMEVGGRRTRRQKGQRTRRRV